MRSMWGIISRVLPEDEHEAAEALSGALKQLELTTAEFISAVALFDATRHLARDEKDRDRREIVSKWPLIAARTGALCLFDFYECTEAINYNLNRCPTLMRLMDKSEKKEGRNLFKKSFPNYDGTRHAAAHPGEIHSTPEKKALNSVRVTDIPHLVLSDGPSDNTVAMSGSLFKDQYSLTYRGKLVGYAVNAESASALEQVLTHWQNAFEGPSQHTRDLRNAELLKNQSHPPPGPIDGRGR